MRWSEYRDRLPLAKHRRLVLAVTSGLHEARMAAETVTEDGDLDELRGRLDTAVAWLTEARSALGGLAG
jgi:hypothetical protein